MSVCVCVCVCVRGEWGGEGVEECRWGGFDVGSKYLLVIQLSVT